MLGVREVLEINTISQKDDQGPCNDLYRDNINLTQFAQSRQT